MVMFCKYIQKLSPKIKPIEKKLNNPEKTMESEVKISSLKNTPKLSPVLITKNVFFIIFSIFFLIFSQKPRIGSIAVNETSLSPLKNSKNSSTKSNRKGISPVFSNNEDGVLLFIF